MRILGWFITYAAAAAAGVLLLLTLAPWAQVWHEFVVYTATFIPFLWIACLVVGLGLTLLLRRFWRALGVLVMAVVFALWAVPLIPSPWVHVTSDVRPQKAGIVVFSLNLQFGRADVTQIKNHIDASDADVLAFQEYTPDFEERLGEAGLLERYPHQVGYARTDAGGTMLLSKQPLTIVGEADTAFHNFVATTTINGVPWHIGAIHSTPPQMGAGRWAEDARKVTELAKTFIGEQLILIGDFNAIEEHLPMRQLARVGMRLPSGHRWEPTWPVGRRIPAFARIDHCLWSPRVLGWAPSYIEVTGSDHKGLIAAASAPE